MYAACEEGVKGGETLIRAFDPVVVVDLELSEKSRRESFCPSNERREFAGNFAHGFLRQLADEFGAPDAPIEAFHLIGENHAGELRSRRDRHLERVSFNLARYRAQDRQPDFAVVRRRREDKRRPPAGLFVAGLRGECYPDDVAARGDVPARHYQISRPTGRPKSASACRWFFSTRSSRCLSDPFRDSTGVAITRPSETARFKIVPCFTSASSARGLGVLTAKLFPHFLTRTRILS